MIEGHSRLFSVVVTANKDEPSTHLQRHRDDKTKHSQFHNLFPSFFSFSLAVRPRRLTTFPSPSKELVRTSKSWDGKSLVPYPQGQPEITILRIGIPAGARLETHSHPVINAGVLVSGQLTVKTTDGRVLRLKAGDPIVEVVNTLHYGINEGTVPAEIVVFYAGSVGQAVTVSEQ